MSVPSLRGHLAIASPGGPLDKRAFGGEALEGEERAGGDGELRLSQGRSMFAASLCRAGRGGGGGGQFPLRSTIHPSSCESGGGIWLTHPLSRSKGGSYIISGLFVEIKTETKNNLALAASLP